MVEIVRRTGALLISGAAIAVAVALPVGVGVSAAAEPAAAEVSVGVIGNGLVKGHGQVVINLPDCAFCLED